MKANYFLAILIFSCFIGANAIAQDLKFSDLVFLQKNTLEQIDNLLSRKGWAYNSSVVETDTSGNTYKLASWSLNKNDYNEKAEGWLYIHMYEGYENLLVYQTYKLNFEKLKDEIRKTLFKHTKTDVLTNSFYTVYENGSYKVIFETSKNNEGEESYNSDKLYYQVTTHPSLRRQAHLQPTQATLKNQRLQKSLPALRTPTHARKHLYI